MVAISKKQDKGYLSRTPLDTERKYNQKIRDTSEKVEELEKEFSIDETLSATSKNPVENRVVTNALSQKVNTVPNKDLSTNDFTDSYKNELENCSVDRHAHSNKTLLDSLTETDITGVISSSIAENTGHIFLKSGLLLQWGVGEVAHTITYDVLVLTIETETKWLSIGFKSIGGENI